MTAGSTGGAGPSGPTGGPERGDPVGPGGASGLQPTSPVALLGWALAGLVGGWFLHPYAERLLGTAPLVSWTQPGALAIVAVVVGWTAWTTWSTLHVRRERLATHQAVNRLVLARAAAVVGALTGGGYLGYGLSWLGDRSALADERLWRSLAAALAGVLLTVAALLLERACRVRKDDPEA